VKCRGGRKGLSIPVYIYMFPYCVIQFSLFPLLLPLGKLKEGWQKLKLTLLLALLMGWWSLPMDTPGSSPLTRYMN
jgi:hypothetical protein